MSNHQFAYAYITTHNIIELFKDIKGMRDERKWEQAIQEELNSLMVHPTWFLVPKQKKKILF